MNSDAVHRRIGFLYVFLAMTLWSTAEVVVRFIVEDIPALQLGALRFCVGGLFLLTFLPGELRRRGLRLNRQILLHAAWMALIGMTVANICFQYSLEHAGAGVVATLFGANPIIVAVLGAMMLREPLTGPKLTGVLLGFAGLLVLATSEQSEVFTVLGFTLAFVFVCCFSFFTVAVKRFAGPYAGLPIVALCAGLGGAYFIPIALIHGDFSYWANWRELWLPLLYLSIGITGFAYLFFFMGLARVDATQAASIILLKPPLATALAALVLDEPITWRLAVSIALVLGGLYLVIVVYRVQSVRPVNDPEAPAEPDHETTS
ncbi:MAG: DMT family transporter [Candidatus Hydrogenedentota bacterium]